MLAGELWESGRTVAKQHTDDMLTSVKQILMRCYYRIAEMTDWVAMRNTASKTFAATDTTGLYLPSNLIGVLGVVCETDGSEQIYEETSEERRFIVDGKHHWYHPSRQVSALEDLDNGISISEGAAAFSGTLGADRTGEYIRFEGVPGYYLVGASQTITPRYWGPTLLNKGAVVRPPETKKMAIVDDAGDFDANTVNVYYWQYPAPLFRDRDKPLLPDTRALELMMWIDIIGPLEKRSREAKDYRKELYGPQEDGREGALADLLSKNPKFLGPAIPKGANGRVLKYGRRR